MTPILKLVASVSSVMRAPAGIPVPTTSMPSERPAVEVTRMTLLPAVVCPAAKVRSVPAPPMSVATKLRSPAVRASQRAALPVLVALPRSRPRTLPVAKLARAKPETLRF